MEENSEKASGGKSKLQQLEKDDLLKLLKKQSDLAKTLKAHLEKTIKEKDALKAQLEACKLENGQENGHTDENDLLSENETLKNKMKEMKQSFENDLENCKRIEKELTAERDSLRERIEEAEKKLTEKKVDDSSRTLQEDLAASQAIQAELRSQLDDAQHQITAFREKGSFADVFTLELADYEHKVSALTTERDQLKTELASIKDILRTATEDRDTMQKSLNEAVSVREALAEQLQQLQESFDDLKMKENDREAEYKKNLQSKLTEESQGIKRVMDLTSQLSEVNNKMNLMESALFAVTKQRDELTSERDAAVAHAEHVRTEFEQFKTRAKFVLEQQSKDESVQLTTEVAELRQKLEDKDRTADAEIKRLTNEFSMQVERYSQLKEMNRTLQSESDRWRREVSEIQKQRDTVMDELRDVRTNFEQTRQQERREHSDEIRMQTHMLETMQENLKSQFSREKDLLLARIDQLELSLSDEKQRREEVSKQSEQRSISVIENRPPSQEMLHSMLMPQRSEMSTPMDFGGDPNSDVSLSDVLFGEDRGFTTENVPYEELLAKLEQSIKQISTLSGLLADSEESSERNVQQIKVLKDEIRRLERNVERVDHAGKSEYLKNIFLQFMKPEKVSGERQQLVPIIKTMLQLSDAECDFLKNLSMTDDATSTPASTPGLGAFFHRWNGLS